MDNNGLSNNCLIVEFGSIVYQDDIIIDGQRMWKRTILVASPSPEFSLACRPSWVGKCHASRSFMACHMAEPALGTTVRK